MRTDRQTDKQSSRRDQTKLCSAFMNGRPDDENKENKNNDQRNTACEGDTLEKLVDHESGATQQARERERREDPRLARLLRLDCQARETEAAVRPLLWVMREGRGKEGGRERGKEG